MTKEDDSRLQSPNIAKDARVKLAHKLGGRFSHLHSPRNTIGEATQLYSLDDTHFPILNLETVNQIVDFMVIYEFLEEAARRGAIAMKVFTGEIAWEIIDTELYTIICQEYGIPVEAFRF